MPRKDEIALYCEDGKDGRSCRLFEAALQALVRDIPLARDVAPYGMLNKNDVQVRAKFARQDSLRAFGLRDRDFLPRALADGYRRDAFHRSHEQVRPWPLSRYCVESYLLDDDVLCAAVPAIEAAVLKATVEEAAAARRWLDIARGVLDDFAFRLRKLERTSIKDRPPDREAALCALRDAAEIVRLGFAAASDDLGLVEKLDALDADMASDGPLWYRVDGRELVGDVERALSITHAGSLPAGGLLSALDRKAHEHPPVGLLAELREVLEAIPPGWRSPDLG